MSLFCKHRIIDSILMRPSGRDVVEYRDGDRPMEINAERLGGNPKRIATSLPSPAGYRPTKMKNLTPMPESRFSRMF
jgi:hypothetical protein